MDANSLSHLNGKWSPSPPTSPPASRTTLSRPLGLLERRFALNAQRNGMSDSFMSFVIHAPLATLRWRIALAWTTLRSLHPALALTSLPNFTYSHPTSPRDAYSLALANILTHSSPLPTHTALRDFIDNHLINGPRRFLSTDDLARLILVTSHDPSSVGIIITTSHIVSDGQSTLSLCQQFLDLLASPRPIPLLPAPVFQSTTEFLLNSSPTSPSSAPPPTTSHRSDTPHDRLDDATTTTTTTTTTMDSILREWSALRPLDEMMERLPLATETLYPSLPLVTTSSLAHIPAPIDAPTTLLLANATSQSTQTNDGDPTTLEGSTTTREGSTTTTRSTVARKRWFWAISKVLAELDTINGPRIAPARTVVNIELDLPNVARRTSELKSSEINSRTEANVGVERFPLSQWEEVEFSKEGTQTMLRFCRKERISPSMMLYGILSVALSNLHLPSTSSPERKPDSRESSKTGVGSKKSKILIGLPLSLRPFLVTPSTHMVDSPPSSATDMAIRIGFGNLILDVLPSHAAPSTAHSTLTSIEPPRDDLARTVVQNARLAKIQFNEMFAAPGSTAASSRVSKLSIYLAKLYWSHYGKVLNSLGLPASNAIPPVLNPATPTPMSIGASMVGDCDRLLASSFSLPLPPLATTTTSSPPFATPRRREVKISSFYLGTRLHAREILIEGYKWGGQIHFTVGFDNFDVVAGTTSGRELLVRSILAEVERVGNRLVEQVLAEEVGGGSKL